MDVSTDYLKPFVAVSECSYSLAVSRVHKSQGAISTQIAKLEEQAGIKLIDRSQRHFRLTEAGEIFLTFAKETLAKAQQVKRLFEELNAGIKGEIRIGATRSVGIYVLAIPTRGGTISNLQARKEAARAGVGVAVLPGFAVRNEVRDRTLKKLVVKNIQLDDTYLILVEPARQSAQ